MLEPVLSAVGMLIDVRLGFLGELGNATSDDYRGDGGAVLSGLSCLHGPSECVGDAAQLCVHRHWPDHVDVETSVLAGWSEPRTRSLPGGRNRLAAIAVDAGPPC